MTRYKPFGWRNDNYRHSLAAKGIATRKSFALTGRQRLIIRDYPEVSESIAGRRIAGLMDRDMGEIRAAEEERAGAAGEFFDTFKDVKTGDEFDEDLVEDAVYSTSPRTLLEIEAEELLKEEMENRPFQDATFYEVSRRKRQSMAYVPTYVAGDLSAIGVDALGTAGAATVGLIPLVVGAGVIYGGAKYVKKDIDKNKKKRESMAIKYTEHKGNRQISLENEDSAFPFAFGRSKAKLFIKRADEIKKFAEGKKFEDKPGIVEYGEYKDNDLISLYGQRPSEDMLAKRGASNDIIQKAKNLHLSPISFGRNKAKLITNHLDEIKKFAEEESNVGVI